MKRLTLLLAVASLGLGAWAVREYLERTRLAAENEDLTAQLAAVQPRIDRLPQQEQENRRLTAKVTSLEKEIEAAKTKAESGNSADPKKKAGDALAGSLAKMMTDPKMRDAMHGQAKMGVEMMYRDLFELLNLPDDQRAKLEKLILDKATVGMDAAFSMMGADKTMEEKKAATADIKKKIDEVDAEIKGLLSADDYSKVKRYEDSTMERMQLKTFDGMLKSKELALDDATESKLMDVMYEERRKFPFASDFANQQNPDISRFTPENTARFADEYTQLNSRIADRAAGILQPAQLEVFKQSQDQQMNMIRMQMEMGAKMFGSEGK